MDAAATGLPRMFRLVKAWLRLAIPALGTERLDMALHGNRGVCVE